MTIVEFLLARIAEDEAVATAATQGDWHWYSYGNYEGSDMLELRAGDAVDSDVLRAWGAYADSEGIEAEEPDKAHIVRWQPSRVLAECKAKRAIVEAGFAEWDRTRFIGCETAYGEGQDCTTYHAATVALASIYADHPDYDPAWKL